MTDNRFPLNPLEITSWSNREQVSAAEGSRKYAQYLVLQAISNNQRLKEVLVFKGGNALEFIYLPNRSTVDLDFSFIRTERSVSELLLLSEKHLDAAAKMIDDGYGTVIRLQSMKQNPPRPDAQFPTITARIGYALPDQQHQIGRLLAGQSSANVIPVEMTVNEIVCEYSLTTIGNNAHELNVSTLNDIMAEKLRAILQQKTRNRYRGQDILDIASLWSDQRDQIDTARVSDYLLRKSAARNVVVSRSAFHDPEIRLRSSQQYDDLQQTTRYTFIPFDEAWEIVMNLVNQLDIPN